MLSKATTKLEFLMTGLMVLAAVALIGLDDPTFRVGRPAADAARWVTMTLCGFSAVLMVGLLRRAGRIKLDREDVLLRPAVAHAHCWFALNFYAVVSMAQLLKNPGVTWRTPFLLIVATISCRAQWTLSGRLERMLDRAEGRTVRLTLVDTETLPGDVSVDLTVPAGTAVPGPPNGDRPS